MIERDNRRGIVLMLLAVLLLSLMDAGLKALSPHYSPLQVAALRGGASWPLVTAWILLRSGVGALKPVRWSLHLLRGAIGVTMMTAFVYALRELPLTTAYTLFFIAPLLITLMSRPLLGETIGLHRWVAIVGGFVGVLVALRPSTGGAGIVASLCVIAAASGYALSAITVRVLARTDSPEAMVFWVITLMTLGAGVLAGPGWMPVRLEHGWLIAAVGLTGALGQFAITGAFVRGEASVLAPLEYTALVWSVAFDALLWAVLPEAATWLGAAIIVACGVYLVRQERVAAMAANPQP
ncbi:MAG TPA: DMT family transporter [Verrucomicrobiae bacterium]|nr:DMT family transporter [Verrucomicrobiae bacterium]